MQEEDRLLTDIFQFQFYGKHKIYLREGVSFNDLAQVNTQKKKIHWNLFILQLKLCIKSEENNVHFFYSDIQIFHIFTSIFSWKNQ